MSRYKVFYIVIGIAALFYGVSGKYENHREILSGKMNVYAPRKHDRHAFIRNETSMLQQAEHVKHLDSRYQDPYQPHLHRSIEQKQTKVINTAKTGMLGPYRRPFSRSSKRVPTR